MVSSSETVRQLNTDSLKTASNKMRTSHNTDAFKQIFADVAKAKESASDNIKDVVTRTDSCDDVPAKQTSTPKIQDKKPDCRAERNVDQKDDAQDGRTAIRDENDTEKETVAIRKPAKVDTKDVDDNANDTPDDKKPCEEKLAVSEPLVTPVDVKAEITPVTDIVDVQTFEVAPVEETAADTQVAQAVQPHQNIPNPAQAAPQEKPVTALDSSEVTAQDEKVAFNPQATEQIKTLTFRAGLAVDTDKTGKRDAKSADLATVENIPAEIKNATHEIKLPEAEKKTTVGQEIKTVVKQAKEDNASIPEAIANFMDTMRDEIKDQKEVTKDSNYKDAQDKNSSKKEMIQAAHSNTTPEQPALPAASGRAISAALTASVSPAPNPNGTLGGGPQLTAKIEGANAANPAMAGLQGVHSSAQTEQASFANLVRGAKETSASLMQPAEQVAVQLHRMAKNGTDRYDLQLHPADLGRIDIRLEINKEGNVLATITADNQQAFDMLQKDSRSLERALQQAGLQTDSGSLSFNLRGGDSQHAQQQAQQNQGNGLSKWLDKTVPENEAQSKIVTFNTSVTPGRVNVMV